MTADAPPATTAKRGTLNARVERIVDHTSDTRSLFLSLTSGKHLRFVPGQFISITIPLGDETRSRPYSVASDPEDRGPFEICFNRVAGGRGVAWLFDLRVGDTLDFSGPFGAFTIDRRAGGGTGLHRGRHGDRADSPDAETSACLIVSA